MFPSSCWWWYDQGVVWSIITIKLLTRPNYRRSGLYCSCISVITLPLCHYTKLWSLTSSEMLSETIIFWLQLHWSRMYQWWMKMTEQHAEHPWSDYFCPVTTCSSSLMKTVQCCCCLLICFDNIVICRTILLIQTDN